MSFEKLTEEELLAAAEMLAVDLDSTRTPAGKISRKQAAAAFAEEGVTWDIYQEELARRQAIVDDLKAKAEEEKRLEEQRLAATISSQDLLADDSEVEPVADEVVTTRARPRRSAPNEVLVKMNRQNPHYEVNGKVFTKEHPFVLMSEAEAQEIFDRETGFHIATPREAAEYYG